MKPRYLLLLMTGLITGCANLLPQLQPRIPAQETAVAQRYMARCGACHTVPDPRRLSFQGWKKLIPVMEQRMRERGLEELGESDRKAILDYLKTHNRG